MTKLRTRALLLAAVLVAMSDNLVSCAQEGGGAPAAVCPPSSCGDIRNISFPFRLPGDPPGCGLIAYELKCEANVTILEIFPNRYWVKAIWYEDEAIQVIDARANAAGISFLFSAVSTDTYAIAVPSFSWKSSTNFIRFINCTMPLENRAFVKANSCMYNTSSSPNSVATGSHLYWYSVACPDCGFPQGCHVVGTWLSEFQIHLDNGSETERTRCLEVRDALLQGFNLTWEGNIFCYVNKCSPPRDEQDCSERWLKSSSCFFLLMFAILTYPILYKPQIIITAFIVRSSIGYIALLSFLAYKLRRRLLGINDDVETLLAEYRNYMPTRYSYRQIRKMTGNFKEKLGQGGFGSVYRGKQLAGRRPVAVKILGKSDSKGQDFINEVATIGRIHHVNVVQLVGFCVEGSNRALVYEFMPNGSLDRHIYDKGEGAVGKPSLSWRKTLEIAVGIARGIEYLHRGCDVKILHFDIKPQNVLLDEDFNPKIADFGLAKSYPAEKNTVTMTAVRGTIGYMAPELFYASAGGVSSKSDVYSFGMLLMEMAGRRKNVDPGAGSCSGEDYLPSLIYNQLEQGKDITVVGAATEEEKMIINKLFIVALWCIQMKPEDRPSMGKVVGMLEGDDVQQLKMPARPFLASTDLVNLEGIVATGSGSTEVPTVPLLSSDAD